MKKLLRLLTIGLSLAMLTACSSGGDKNNGNYDGGGQQGDGGGQQGEGGQHDGGNKDTTAEHLVGYTIEDYADLAGWENGTKYSSFKLDSVVTITSNGGGNTGKYYETDESYRLYGTENASISISVSEGHTLKSIMVTYTSKDGCKLKDLASGEVVGATSNTMSFPLSQNSGQVRVTEIKVGYDGEAGEDPFVRDDWTAEEKEIIDEYFYGIDIPFIYYPGIALTFDDYYGSAYIMLNNLKLADLKAYIDAYEASTAWTNIDEEVQTNNATYEGVVTTEEGDRYVNAYLYLINDDDELITSDNEAGYLIIEFQDPYYYEWDKALFEEIASVMKSEATIPKYEGLTRLQISESEETTEIYVYILDETEARFLAYKEKFTGWTVTDIESIKDRNNEEAYKLFTAIPASDDLLMEVKFYSKTGVVEIDFIKHLPHLAEFPMAEVKEYNGGIEVPVPAGAEYFTGEKLDYVLEFGDEQFVFPMGYEVVAYGIDEDELKAYEALLVDYEVEELMEEDDEGEEIATGEMLVSMIADDGMEYSFTYVYDEESEILDMLFDGPSNIYSFAEWSKVVAKYNEFKTEKEITADIPELTIGEDEVYHVQMIIGDEEYYDQFTIAVDGNKEAAWVAILKAAEFDVPATPNQYGYECLDKTEEIEIDVIYDEESGYTYASVYVYADLIDG